MTCTGGRRSVLLVVASLLVLVVGATTVTPVVGAQERAAPTVTLSVDGTVVEDGSTTYVNSSVRIRVDAETGDGSADGVELTTVEIRVNGTTTYRSNVSAESVTVTQPVELSAGNNSVAVSVSDSAGTTTTERVHVYRDERSPRIRLTAPDTLADGTPDRGSVVDTPVTLAGVITDDVGFSHGSIRIFHHETTYRNRTRITNTDFEHDLRLGRGDNTVVVTATDEQGNTRTKRVVLAVTDTVDPRIHLRRDAKIVHDRNFTVDARITDEVWVRRATVRVEHLNAPGLPRENYVPAPNRPYEVSTERQQVSLSQNISLTLGRNRITVAAVDHRGHRSTRSMVVEYYPVTNTRPRIELREDANFWLPPNTSNAERTNSTFWSRTDPGQWVEGSLALTNGTFRVDAVVSDPDHDLDHVTLEVRKVNAEEPRVLTRNFQMRGDRRARVFAELNLSFRAYVIQLRAVDRRGKSALIEFRIGPPPTDIEYVSRLSRPALTPGTFTRVGETTTDSASDGATATATTASGDGGSTPAGGNESTPAGGGDGGNDLFVFLYVGAAVVVVLGVIGGVVLLRR